MAVKDIQENETIEVDQKRLSRAVFALEALEEPLEEVGVRRLVLRAKTQVSEAIFRAARYAGSHHMHCLRREAARFTLGALSL